MDGDFDGVVDVVKDGAKDKAEEVIDKHVKNEQIAEILKDVVDGAIDGEWDTLLDIVKDGVVDIAEGKGRFEKTITEFHSFSAVQVLDSSIILAGSANGKAFFTSYDKFFFRYNWLREIDTTSELSLAQSFQIFEEKEAIIWYGTRIHADHTTDGLIGFLKTDGTNVYTRTLTDSIMGRSAISCMERSNDSTLWFGGAHNFANVNQGLIGTLTFDTSFRFIPDEDTLIGTTVMFRPELRVFPNPTKGIIHLECPGQVIQSVNMYDMMGQEVDPTVIKLDISQVRLSPSIQAGHYVIQVETDAGIMRQVIEVVR